MIFHVKLLPPTLRNSQLYMLNFTKLKKVIAQHDLETETKTFKAIDEEVKELRCLVIYNVWHIFSHLYTPFIQHREISI